MESAFAATFEAPLASARLGLTDSYWQYCLGMPPQVWKICPLHDCATQVPAPWHSV
jgi:hypothetical protein